MTPDLSEFNHLPRFPDGRIDYTNADKAPGLSCFIKYEDKILLLKRSDKVMAYKGQWFCLGGFIDEPKSIRQKVLEELHEELGLSENDVKNIKTAPSYTYQDSSAKKSWILYPVIVELNNQPEIKLDWEHTAYKWVKKEELASFDLPSTLREALKKVSWD